MRNEWIYHRGDVYIADLNPYIGSEQGGIRPVVVLQNDVGNHFCPTLIIAPITSKSNKKAEQPTHYYLDRIMGTDCSGTILLEQIKTIDKLRISKYLGKLSCSQMDKLEQLMKISLGICI